MKLFPRYFTQRSNAVYSCASCQLVAGRRITSGLALASELHYLCFCKLRRQWDIATKSLEIRPPFRVAVNTLHYTQKQVQRFDLTG